MLVYKKQCLYRAFNNICTLVEVKEKEKEVLHSWSLEIVEMKRKHKNAFINYKRTDLIDDLKKCRSLDKEIKKNIVR